MNIERAPAPRAVAVSAHAPRIPDPGAAKYMLRAAWGSVGVAVVLVVVKGGAYFYTGSVAVLAALADSAIDLVASLGNLVAVRQALMPADRQHRFGHGKAEPLAGLAQGAFIAVSTSFLAFESVRHLLAPHPLAHGMAGVLVILFSMAATLGLVAYQRRAVRRSGSVAIAADSMHYSGDLLTNAGVVAALILSTYFGWYLADPLIGLAVAAILVWSAWWVVRRSSDQLMDRELPEADRERIKDIVFNHKQVRGLHDLRTRSAGAVSFIQIHIELDPGLSLVRAHQASDEVESALLKAFPGAEILIHIDPHGIEAPPPLALS